MIIGTGVDIVEIDRIERSIERYGESFLKKVFTSDEVKYCIDKKNKYQHFAARFAAKEAVVKAFGSTGEKGFSWTDIEVYNELGGQPMVKLYGKFEKYQSENMKLHITISHTHNYAVCFAVLDKIS